MSLPTMTEAEIADRALVVVGAKAAGVNASAVDAKTATEALRSRYDRLRPKGQVNFPLTAIPSWAQQPLINMVAFDIAPSFSVSLERYQVLQAAERQARADLQAGSASAELYVVTKGEFS